LVWRASVPPAALGALLARLPKVDECASHLNWHAGAGDGRLRVYGGTPPGSQTTEGDNLRAARFLGEMRAAASEAGGSLVVERCGPKFRDGFDAWGLTESAALLMARVKEQLDPSNTFSPGRCGFILQSRD
jgi:FAD/FMN-containing dehydrogenase